MLGTRTILDFRVIQILEYMHRLHQLSIPILKIQNAPKPKKTQLLFGSLSQKAQSYELNSVFNEDINCPDFKDIAFPVH